MFKIGNYTFDNPLILAPMEDITDKSFRKICIELGADLVFTEFINCEGLIRLDAKTHKKMKLNNDERPVGIQIYGENIESLIKAAELAEEEKPEIIDLNAGCWVKKVSGRGAGAGLMKNPEYLAQIVKEIVKVVKTPVTVKTRLGWDEDSINILDIAKRIEDAGAKLLTLHCRTRSQGHTGDPDWSWIEKVKNIVSIPVILNGGLMTVEDFKKAKAETNADGFMIARGAINHPWIFKEIKDYLLTGNEESINDHNIRIDMALKHLKYSIEVKEEKRAVIEFRKFYSGYLKGMHSASKIRNELMKYHTYNEIEEKLFEYKDYLNLDKI